MNKESLSKSKILDKIKLYEKTGAISSTGFLDPLEIIDNQSIFSKYPHVLFGGHEEAERKLIIFGIEENDDFFDFAVVLKIESQKELSHSEVLGSLLGTGIKRDVVGDILIDENIANVFVEKNISKYIIQNLTKIGREKVKISIIKKDEIIVPKDLGKQINITIPSLRLDALISSTFGISREISSKLIESERVKLNYRVVTNTSKQIKEFDLISVRGYGRIVFEEIVGETRKERIRVKVKVYKRS